MLTRIIFPAVCLAALAGCGGTGTMAERLATGDSWFRMEDPEGKPQGYAHILVGAVEDGGRRIDWVLKLAFPGGKYEEWRSMTIGAEGELVAASYSSGEDFSTDLRRKGEEWAVATARGGKTSSAIRELPDDATTELSFVLASTLSREAGPALVLTEVSEAKEFEVLGPVEISWAGEESVEIDGEKVAAHLFELSRADGKTVPIWIGDDGAIVQVDWGGGNLMKRSDAGAEALYKPEAPAVAEVPGDPGELVVTGLFPGATPEELYDRFTRPELLTGWWPQKAEVEVAEGGKYVLAWPEMEWTMRGEVRAFERGRLFAFTWTWDHEPDAPAREVRVSFAPHTDGGTKLDLTHGPYGDTEEEREARRGHLQGWQHFLTRLRAATGGASATK